MTRWSSRRRANPHEHTGNLPRSPKASPTSFNGETFVIVVDDELNEEGRDGETDDFLKFLRVFDETKDWRIFGQFL